MWRYPDRPAQGTLAAAELWNSDSYFTFEKWNGWRVFIMFEELGIQGWTRHHRRLSDALHRDDDFAPELLTSLMKLHVPNGTIDDCEFMNRPVQSVVGLPPEFVVVHDLLQIRGEWQGQVTLSTRMQRLMQIMSRYRPRSTMQTIALPTPIPVSTLEVSFEALRAKNQGVNLHDGIVLKRKNSLLVGGVDRAATNPGWMKVRF